MQSFNNLPFLVFVLLHNCSANLPCPKYLIPSLFANVPPYIQFQSISQKRIDIPTEIKEKLLWPEAAGQRKELQDKTILASGLTLVSKRDLRRGNMSLLGWLRKPSGKLISQANSFQKINSFPSVSTELCYRFGFWANLYRFQQKYQRKVSLPFIMPSFILPDEMPAFKSAWEKTQNKLWICKTPRSSVSRGVRMLAHWQDFKINSEPCLAQKYVHNPILYDNLKLNFKYVFLLTSVHPLRIYSFPGLNLIQWTHSNYSISPEHVYNKCIHSRPSVLPGTPYCDRTTALFDLKPEDYNKIVSWFHAEYNMDKLLQLMDHAVILTLLSAEKRLAKAFYKKARHRQSFFHLMDADFVVDVHGKPWLIEMNSSPIRILSSNGYNCHKYQNQDFYSKVLNIAGFNLPPTLNLKSQDFTRSQLNLANSKNVNFSKVVLDETLYKIELSKEEIQKHIRFENFTERNSYRKTILQELTQDDIRILMISEDELNRAKGAKRIFPTKSVGKYVPFIESSTYYYKLLDAWEEKYGDNRSEGRKLLEHLSQEFL